jgi:hypothetical protein
MRYQIDEPIDAEFEVLSPDHSRSTALDQLAFATVAVVLISIFACICAGAALAAALLTAN